MSVQCPLWGLEEDKDDDNGAGADGQVDEETVDANNAHSNKKNRVSRASWCLVSHTLMS